jgi:hypothetical protein
MSDNTENLVLEHLKRIQTTLAAHGERFTHLELRLSAIESHLAAGHLDSVQLTARIDGVDKRLERIERRLELVEAP